MAASAPTETPSPKGGPPAAADLLPRVMSALIMIPVALAATWYGGTVFALGAIVLGIGVFIEWLGIVETRSSPQAMVTGAVIIAGAGLMVMLGRTDAAAAVVGLAAVAAAAYFALGAAKAWPTAGLAYSAALVVALIALRGDDWTGFLAVLLLFAATWSTDIFAYFVGRAIGGPKLAPRYSPKKTWSGAVGGLVAAVAAGALFALVAGIEQVGAVIAISAALSIAGQFGDFMESGLKRRFGVKDSSRIIPGHGGLMDRIDALTAAAFAAAVIGFLRAGFDAPAEGVLQW